MVSACHIRAGRVVRDRDGMPVVTEVDLPRDHDPDHFVVASQLAVSGHDDEVLAL
jgi:hypothetical protein